MLVRSLDRCRHDAGRCECRSRPDIGRGMISIYGSIVLLYSLSAAFQHDCFHVRR
jgi:hypothetical protein